MGARRKIPLRVRAGSADNLWTGLVEGLQATASLSRELGGESDLARVLELVTKRARALMKVRSSYVLLREGELREALAQGGTSFDSLYVNVNGESGYFDRSLDAYGRDGLPCRRCGAVMRREKFMNRSSFYCPKCQPAPRMSRPGG